MPAETKSKFRKKRLFKVSRELNISVDSIVQHIKDAGFTDALSGDGLNAAITSEEAYNDLLDAYAEDKAIAARVKSKRAARDEAEAEPEAAIEGDGATVVETPEDPVRITPIVELDTAPAKGVEAPAAAVEEAISDDVAADGVAEEKPVAEPTAEEAVVEVALPEAETVAVAPPAEEIVEAPVETVIAETPEAVTEAAPAEEAAEVPATPETVEAVTEDAAAAEVALEPAEEDEEADTISATRYKLEGTKVLGTMDLGDVDADSTPAKRKRKRKRKGTGAGDTTVRVDQGARESASQRKKRKGKRGPSVDQSEVDQSLQDTLREMEHGTSRARSRRRRLRREQHAADREREAKVAAEESSILKVTEYLSTGELANLMDVGVNEIIGALFSAGMMVSINQRLDADTITFVAAEFGFDVEFITEFGTDDIIIEEDAPEDLEPRAPVVTVMGHVDHGKTSMLDYIRNANVVAGEAGGITQHIGAYHVILPNDKRITFLDTPGHEAFTAMRARGAKVTDVVILVVAADDSVKPQTIEAINHARAAEVPLVVAINKIDKPEANTQRVMQELADENVLVEPYGGKVQCSLVSAKTGDGIQDLLDKVLLESELLDLKANPDRQAVGTVIESRREKGRGVVATVLVQNGSLSIGNNFVAGIYSGRVRAMYDERDNRIQGVGPSKPALVVGFDGAPEVGDQFIGVDIDKEAKEIAQRRQQIHREQSHRQRKHITLDEIGRRLALGEFRELNLIVKGDVGGSVEALSDALLKLSTEEVAVNIVHTGVGAITETDVMLASASDAVIIGFQVRPMPNARELAEREEIDIRIYSIIYDAISDVRDALEGLLSPEKSEKTLGTAEVRETFKVPKAGTVAGCHVTHGVIKRNERVRLIREGVVIYEGNLASLKRFKDDVKEVVAGYECGMGMENYDDIKVGDQFESYEIIEIKRTLEA